jgi:hypothetical protein
MLTVDSVIPFLLEHGLFDLEWIIDGDLSVRSVARRNRNLRVDGPAGIGFLIKQPDDPARGGSETLRREAAFYALCREEPSLGPVAAIVPRLLWTDASACILVFDLIAGASTLRSCWETAGGTMTKSAAMSFGRAMATIHRACAGIVRDKDPRLAAFSSSPPWGIWLHRPNIAELAHLCPARLELLRILQTQEGIRDRLDRLYQEWQTPTLIHGDIKFDNVLISEPTPRPETGPGGVWIADWEMAQLGDPAWDLAGALQDLIVLWVASMPLAADTTLAELASQARIPIGVLRTAARAVWYGYRDGAELQPSEADQLLLRAVELSAARLMQSAFEAADGSDRLPGWSVISVQIAANLLANPGRGQVELYGIPQSWPFP